VSNRFSSGKNAISQCDRCGFRFKLKELKTEVVKTKPYNVRVCSSCWDPDHPQLQLGMYPVEDPQAVRNPRPDTTYVTAGVGVDGELTGGSRIIQWGWAPVGGARDNDVTPNDLIIQVQLGTVAVLTS
jgi:hypothetical protein